MAHPRVKARRSFKTGESSNGGVSPFREFSLRCPSGKTAEITRIEEMAKSHWLPIFDVGICLMIGPTEDFPLTTKFPEKPESGTLLIIDKNILKRFRKDGHVWKKKTVKENSDKDRRSTGKEKEPHQLFQVGENQIECYYATGEQDKTFHRHFYYFTKGSSVVKDSSATRDLVLVHYLETTETRKSTSWRNKTNGGRSIHENLQGPPSPSVEKEQTLGLATSVEGGPGEDWLSDYPSSDRRFQNSQDTSILPDEIFSQGFDHQAYCHTTVEAFHSSLQTAPQIHAPRPNQFPIVEGWNVSNKRKYAEVDEQEDGRLESLHKKAKTMKLQIDDALYILENFEELGFPLTSAISTPESGNIYLHRMDVSEYLAFTKQFYGADSFRGTFEGDVCEITRKTVELRGGNVVERYSKKVKSQGEVMYERHQFKLLPRDPNETLTYVLVHLLNQNI